MSQIRIRKSFRVISCTVATAAASCTAIRMDDMSGGVVQLPAVAGSGTLSVLSSATETGTYGQLYDSAGNAASVTVPAAATTAGTTYALPAAVASAPYIKLVGSANVTGVASEIIKS